MLEVALISLAANISAAIVAVGLCNLIERMFFPPASRIIWREPKPENM